MSNRDNGTVLSVMNIAVVASKFVPQVLSSLLAPSNILCFLLGNCIRKSPYIVCLGRFRIKFRLTDLILQRPARISFHPLSTDATAPTTRGGLSANRQ